MVVLLPALSQASAAKSCCTMPTWPYMQACTHATDAFKHWSVLTGGQDHPPPLVIFVPHLGRHESTQGLLLPTPTIGDLSFVAFHLTQHCICKTLAVQLCCLQYYTRAYSVTVTEIGM